MNQRTRAMAVIGMTIGISFGLAMVISPVITNSYGLSGIFYLTCLLALSSIFLLHFIIPTPNNEWAPPITTVNLALLQQVASNKQLQRLNIGIFCQHFILTATFFAIPFI